MGEVGHYFVENIDEYSLNEEMEDFFDFFEFGSYIAEEKGGKFISGGFVYYDGDGQLEELLEGLEPENNEMNMGGIESC